MTIPGKAALEALVKKGARGMKKCCEFLFWYTNKEGEKVSTPGVFRMSHLSGENDAASGAKKERFLVDLVKRDGYGRMCHKCSFSLQRPVYHTKEKSACSQIGKTIAHGSGRSLICQETTPSLNPYEQLRLENIKANQKQMRELGLDTVMEDLMKNKRARIKAQNAQNQKPQVGQLRACHV